ncbi:NHLP bacteriocin system secretion protein [Cohnella panacarvi]|uniref:NHLP bacteriocin system secretion protein n=1 Tax=Cohnella panacarvi TaxID=400776 RepID=UPI000479F66B|nr:NHLP bacteriocin system secretion protein [Cohnella panacarvi]
MNPNLYRKVSVERLSSPEQLDTLMTVTSPRGWLALLASGLLLASAMIWSFFGTMSTKVQSQGVLINPEGVHNIYAQSGGSITDIRVEANEFVHKGDVIARVEQPAFLMELKQLHDELQAAQDLNRREPSAQLSEQIGKLQASIADLQREYSDASTIVSSQEGRVLEVKVEKGAIIGPGTPIISVESGTGGLLQAVIYAPVQVGKTIVPGMHAQLSPSSVNKEEFGFMLGRVASVSEFPMSAEGMMVALGNEALVAELAGSGLAMLEVRIELIPDKHTVSGYKWSTGKGPNTRIENGTLVAGAVTIREQKPITSIIPAIH